jgi:hypothetical protein
MNLSGANLTGPGTQKANLKATEQDIETATITLYNDVTIQYLTALQAAAQTEVARQQVQRNGEFLALAQARQNVGQATLLDVRQSQVTEGQSRVALLVATQTENEAKLELLRRMGVTLPAPGDRARTHRFIPGDRAGLRRRAADVERNDRQSRHPVAQGPRDASVWGVKSAKSQYLPTLTFSAGWQGFTQEFTNTQLLLNGRIAGNKLQAAQCDFQNALIGALPGGGVPGFPNGGQVPDCKTFAGLDATGDALLPEVQQALLDRNNVFPFNFSNQPFQAQVRINLPIFRALIATCRWRGPTPRAMTRPNRSVPASSRSAPTSPRDTSASPPRTRRSACRATIARPRASSSSWRRRGSAWGAEARSK